MDPTSAIVRLGARLFTWNRTIREFWARHARVRPHDDIPWTPLLKDPSDCRVALVTTAGVHLAGDRPFDMSDRRGDPSWREIPSETPDSRLTITHDYYDHRDADQDVGIVYPLERMRELVEAGEIGSLSPRGYGFMGHIGGPHLETLVSRTAPEVAHRLAADEVDLVLLSPA